jgi:hypothetical protein
MEVTVNIVRIGLCHNPVQMRGKYFNRFANLVSDASYDVRLAKVNIPPCRLAGGNEGRGHESHP